MRRDEIGDVGPAKFFICAFVIVSFDVMGLCDYCFPFVLLSLLLFSAVKECLLSHGCCVADKKSWCSCNTPSSA
jgi:hypothetical protein